MYHGTGKISVGRDHQRCMEQAGGQEKRVLRSHGGFKKKVVLALGVEE
jgi:hypothetical protein